MNFYKLFFVLSIFLGGCYSAQAERDTLVPAALKNFPKEKLQKDEFGNFFYYDSSQKAKIYEINGEQVIVMDELLLRYNPKFNNQLDRNFYFFLNKKLIRVYPLFLDALSQYRDIQDDLSNLNTAAKRSYTKKKQEDLAKDYEAKLRDLTTSEGQVFAKLMYRATGKTVYEIIKELRGGWSAFWWNVKGNMADVSLKTPYSPRKYREDYFVENILQNSWNSGSLTPYPGYENFSAD